MYETTEHRAEVTERRNRLLLRLLLVPIVKRIKTAHRVSKGHTADRTPDDTDQRLCTPLLRARAAVMRVRKCRRVQRN